MKITHGGLLLAYASTVASGPIQQRPRPSTFYFFSFGDSYTTTAFNIDGTQPSAGNPMGNPPLGTPFVYPYQKGTFTGGINYVGYLTTKYNTTDVRSYDFAVAGACIDDSTPGCNSQQAASFQTQVSQIFSPRYSTPSPWKTWNGDNSIFSIFFGINDVSKAISSNTSPALDPDSTTKAMVAKYLSLATDLYSLGARRFLFLALPPLDRTPYILTQPAATIAAYKTWVNYFNYHLGAAIPEWQSAHSDVSVSLFDTWHTMTAVLDNPAQYGFPDATCVDAGGQRCVWWNAFHPSAKFNDVLAKRLVPAMDGLGFDGRQPGTNFYSF